MGGLLLLSSIEVLLRNPEEIITWISVIILLIYSNSNAIIHVVCSSFLAILSSSLSLFL